MFLIMIASNVFFSSMCTCLERKLFNISIARAGCQSWVKTFFARMWLCMLQIYPWKYIN